MQSTVRPEAPRTLSDEQVSAVVLWSPSAVDQPRSGRVIETERWGVVNQIDLTVDELVCVSGLVFEGEDEDGAAADFVLPVLVHGGPAELTDRMRETLTWAVGRQLASRGEWRAVELAMSVATQVRRPQEVVRHVTWAAHVASSFGHAGLAWRLISHAEQVTHRFPDRVPPSTRRMVLQVRSGIAARSADVLLGVNDRQGAADIREAWRYLQEARRMGQGDPREETPIPDLTEELRLLEILLLAHRYISAGVDIDLGVIDLLGSLRAGVGAARLKIESKVDPDDDDFAVLMGRVERIESAMATIELDDSALGPFLHTDTV